MIRKLIHEWDKFWFTPTDPIALCVLRILTGCMLLYTHYVWGLELNAFFGPEGWQDPLLVQVQQADSYAFSFWWFVPPEWNVTVHYTCMTILCLFTLGVCTRVTSICAFVITVSYAHRAMNANFGLDQINTLLSFYLMIGPCGAYFSFDRWLKNLRARKNNLSHGSVKTATHIAPTMSARVALQLVEIHMSIIYLFAGLSKLKGEAWWNGNAVWMSLVNQEYQSYDMTWLAWYPELGHLITHSTVIWEIGFLFFMRFKVLRPWVLAIGISMHLGIGAFLSMWTFGLIMIFSYASMIPPMVIHRAVCRVRRLCSSQSSQIVNYDPSSSWSCWFASLRKGLDFRNRIVLEPLSTSTFVTSKTSMPAEQHELDLRTQFGRMRETVHSTIRDQSCHEWVFAETTPLNVDAPRLLIIEPRLSLSAHLQEYFLSKSYECRAETSISNAMQVMVDHPFDAILLNVTFEEDLGPFVEFRDYLIRCEADAPASVMCIIRSSCASNAPASLNHHRVIARQLKLRTLRLELISAWIAAAPTQQARDEIMEKLNPISPSAEPVDSKRPKKVAK